MKRLSKILAAGSLVTSLMGCSAMENMRKAEYESKPTLGLTEYASVHPFVQGSLGVSSNYFGMNVRDIPLEVRDVPINPNDAGTPGPIEPDHADVGALLTFDVAKAGLEVNVSDTVRMRTFAQLGINYDWLAKSGAFGDMYSRNYTNAPGTHKRGYGAALTYYAPAFTAAVIPRLHAEVVFSDANTNAADKSFFNSARGGLILGAHMRSLDTGIITGYDRYDKLSVRETFDVARGNELGVYIGGESIMSQGRFGPPISQRLLLGVTFNDVNPSRHDLTIKKNSLGFFISLEAATIGL